MPIYTVWEKTNGILSTYGTQNAEIEACKLLKKHCMVLNLFVTLQLSIRSALESAISIVTYITACFISGTQKTMFILFFLM